MSKNFNIIILLETKVNYRTNLCIRGFTFIRKDRPISKGGQVGTVISNSLTFSIIPNTPFIHEAIQTLAISIFLINPQNLLTIVAIYRPPSAFFLNQHWISLLNTLPTTNLIFIGGNFNGHNAAWGSNVTDKPSEIAPLLRNPTPPVLTIHSSPPPFSCQHMVRWWGQYSQWPLPYLCWNRYPCL